MPHSENSSKDIIRTARSRPSSFSPASPSSQFSTSGRPSIPRHHPCPRCGTDTAEHERHDASWREASGQRPRRDILSAQIQKINVIAGSVSLICHSTLLTDLEMLGGYRLLLQLQRRFDERGDEPGYRVPFDMAMKEPNPRVVRLEADGEVGVGMDEEGVSPHWRRW